MQVEKKLYCHWDLIRFVSENSLTLKDGSNLTISITSDYHELMIFLGKADSGSDYEVRVYKNSPSDTYVPHKSDVIKHFEENDNYATFFFQDYTSAISFVEYLGYFHPEYGRRPARRISSEN